MNGVPTESYYYTNRGSDDPISSPFPSTDVKTMRYTTTDLEIVDNGNRSFAYYVPVNMQGENSAVTGEGEKPFYAPSSATYISVIVSENEIEYSAIEYRIYLGANLTTNYNLEANKEYEYKITFNGKGDASSDYRIKEIGVIDYTLRESANCYIINPSQDVARVYYLPIEDRINEFWRDYTIKGVPIINASTEWEIAPLWFDQNSGSDAPPESITLDEVVRNNLHAIKVTVPRNYRHHTNLIVADRQK